VVWSIKAYSWRAANNRMLTTFVRFIRHSDTSLFLYSLTLITVRKTKPKAVSRACFSLHHLFILNGVFLLKEYSCTAETVVQQIKFLKRKPFKYNKNKLHSHSRADSHSELRVRSCMMWCCVDRHVRFEEWWCLHLQGQAAEEE
jgi:hypothetical protein